MNNIEGDLALNERIVLTGKFHDRAFQYVAVAALNVGDIRIYNSDVVSRQG